jgi:hypothetical protein
MFLDTNIFLYAAGRSHPLREPCRRVLSLATNRSADATTNAEVLQEILHVWTRRGRPEEARKLALQVAGLFSDLLPVTREDVVGACELLKRYPGLSMRDAVHSASMIHNGIRQIVSVDLDFDKVREIQRVDPASV